MKLYFLPYLLKSFVPPPSCRTLIVDSESNIFIPPTISTPLSNKISGRKLMLGPIKTIYLALFLNTDKIFSSVLLISEVPVQNNISIDKSLSF